MGNFIGITFAFGDVFSVCRDCFFKNATYEHDLRENLATLQKNLEKLIAIKGDVVDKVESEERQPRTRRRKQLVYWLERVELAKTEVGKLVTDSPQEERETDSPQEERETDSPQEERATGSLQEESDDKLCLGGFGFKNLFQSNNEFGRRVTKWSKEVEDLTTEGDKFSSRHLPVTARIHENRPDERYCGTIIGSESTFHEVWTCLDEQQVGVVGLYGMGGVGKTTLLTKIYKKFCEQPNDFAVIWVTLSRSLQLEDIQNTIGEEIGLCDHDSWQKMSTEQKRSEILRILRPKKFALLLDNVWEKVDLETVGIPLPNSENKSKVVFTTRLKEVCCHMGAAPDFKVECLRHDDSWELFGSKVGDGTLNSHPEIPDLAEEVAEECGGLPLALITVAPAMAPKNTPEEWECALDVLKRLAHEFSGLEDQVLRFLKFSYDHLPSDTIRSCFLYCSLFPEDYRISRKELVDCWISEGILDDRNEMQSEGYRNIINDLVRACLLEEVEDNCIKMHDVIRDMSLWIGAKLEKEREGFFVRTSDKLIEVPMINESESIRRMSVIGNEIKSLAMIPALPHLKTLFLNNNHLTEISGSFFESMHSLRVLNLSNNPLTNLPSDISKLVSLQHLNLSRTAIKELPKQLESLVGLKCLNLEHTSQLHRIPRKVISSFSKLRVLRMWDCGSSSQVVEDNVLFNRAESLIEELLCLQHLKMLSITLMSDHAFEIFFDSKKLQNCTQSLSLRFLPLQNCLKALVADLKQLDTLNISDCKCVEEFQFDCSREVGRKRQDHGFRNLHTVNICSCPKLRDLTWLVLTPTLKRLVVSSCSNIEDIICVKKLADFPEKIQRTIPFEKIEYVELRRLENLKSIYWNPMPLQHLKEIKVIQCGKLDKLPLGSNSAKERKIVIEGEQNWWERLKWENRDTQEAFRPCFTNSW